MPIRMSYVVLLFIAILHTSFVRGDIFRWDSGEMIPGTEGIEPGPGVQLDHRELDFADLQDRDLTDSNFSFSNLANAYLSRANAYLSSTSLTNANLTGANLANASLIGSTLTNANLTGAVVTGTNFGGTTSWGFTEEQLYSTQSYQEKNLRGIELWRNDLTGWDFAGQNLANASFGGYLRGSTLTSANLTGANLANARLDESNLASAILTGANLKNASLENARGLGSTVFSADTVYNQWTIFPEGFDPACKGLTFMPSALGDLDGGALRGTSDPWLAGMPNGSAASVTDVAPAQSPVLVPGLDLSLGGVLTFSASGGVSNMEFCPPVCDGPDGGGFTRHLTGAENGLSDLTAPLNSLLGVFLDNSQPNLSPTPTALDFSVLGVNFVSLSPGLKQIFFIGDGLTGTGSGSVQTFDIPSGATRLFLGTMDGWGWLGNTGAFTVTASVPEPSTLLLLACGLAGLGASMRRLRKRLSPTGETRHFGFRAHRRIRRAVRGEEFEPRYCLAAVAYVAQLN